MALALDVLTVTTIANIASLLTSGPALAQDFTPPPDPPAEPPPPPESPEPEYQPPAGGEFPASRSAPSKSVPGQRAGDKSAGGPEEFDDSIIKVPPSEPAKLRPVAPAERKSACAKYEGKYISFYSDIYRVESCKRRQIQDAATLSRVMQGTIKITAVEANVIAALPSGTPMVDSGAKKRRSCKQLEGKFVTFSYVDVYLIQKCKKRLFPDWETFVVWQKKTGPKSGMGSDVFPLSEEEFDLLQIGPEMPSTVDVEFIRQYDHAKAIDIIPLDEACRGVEGKIVSFYSKLYKIEKCRKREMDPEIASAKNPSLNPKELRAEQWYSLPDGKPMKADAPKQSGKPVQYKPLPHTDPSF